MKKLVLFLVLTSWIISCSSPQIKFDKETEQVLENKLIVFNNFWGKSGVKNLKNKIIIPAKFDDVSNFSEGLAIVKFNQNQQAYVDKSGNFSVMPESWHIFPFSENLALISVRTNSNFNPKAGYIDKSFKIVIPATFDEGDYFSEGLAAVKIKNKWGFINKNGQVIIPATFDECDYFSEGLAAVKIKNKWSFINNNGHIIVEPKFDQVNSFSEGLAVVEITESKNRRLGYIDKTGKIVVPLIYSGAFSFQEKLAPVYINSKWQYIDKSGKIVISNQFDLALPFSEGLAAIMIEGKFGFIDQTGKIVIKPQFDRVDEGFLDGVAWAKKDDTWGYIDKKGRWVWIGKDKLF